MTRFVLTFAVLIAAAVMLPISLLAAKALPDLHVVEPTQTDTVKTRRRPPP